MAFSTHADAETAITTLQGQVAARQDTEVKPSGASWQTFARWMAVTAQSPTSGTLHVCGLHLPPGASASAIKTKSATTAATSLTHSWACLLNSSRSVIAVSPDNTGAWSNNVERTFTFGTPLTGMAEGDYYLGIMVAATTPNNLWATAANLNVANISPILCGTADTGLTTPLSLAATAASFTATAFPFYMSLIP